MNQLITYFNNLWTKTIAPSWKRLSEASTDRIVRAIQSKENPTHITVTNPTDINPILEAQNATTEAIKGIKAPIIPETDLSTLETKLEALLVALKEKEMTVNVGKTNIDVDTKGIIKAIEKMHKEMPKMKPQEVIDYTLMFDEMCKIMETPHYAGDMKMMREMMGKLATTEDMVAISVYLQALIDKPLPEQPSFKFNKDGSLLVSPDKVGGGGGGGLTKIETDALSNISANSDTQATASNQTTANSLLTTIAARLLSLIGIDFSTSAKQDEIIAGQDPLSKYKFADLDDDASPNYYGAASNDGAWYILKEDTTAKTLRYATGASDYTTAWTGRAGLTYQYFYEVTLY